MATLILGGETIDVPESLDVRINRLSEGQVECLVLVDRHLSSKEIGLRLNISQHTVDQRVRSALQILQVERRGEAARLIAGAPCPRIRGIYQRLIHQTPHIAADASASHPGAAVGFQIRHADRAGEAGGLGIDTEQRPRSSRPSLPLPFATRSHPRNEMSVGIRLLWIVLIAIAASFSAGMYLAGLESLSRMLSH